VISTIKTKWTVIIFAIESYLQFAIIRKINLENAKNTSISFFDFRENLFPDQKILTVFNLLLSAIGIWLYLKRINIHNVTVVFPTAFTLLISYTLLFGSIFSYFTDYWPHGAATSLAVSSVISQIYIVYMYASEIKKLKNANLAQYLNKMKTLVLSRSVLIHKNSLLYFFIILYPIAVVARNFFIWDYVGQEGRFAMQQAFLFRTFPLESFSVLGEPLSYHYGFDALAAAISALLNLPLDMSNICLSYFLVILFFSSLIGLSKVLFPQLSASKHALVGTAGLYSGGLPFYWGSQDLESLYSGFLPNFDLKGLWILPPTTSFFFQRSFGIGLPIFICLIFLHFNKELASKSSLLLFPKTLLICGLAITNTTLAVTTATIFVLVLFIEAIKVLRNRRMQIGKTLFEPFGLFTIQFLSLLAFNGFFKFLSGNKTSTKRFGIGTCGHLESCISYANWLILSFLISVIGIYLARRCLVVVLVAIAGMGINFFVDFAGSPDILKFAVAPRLFVSIGLMAGLLQMTFRKSMNRVISYSLVLLITLSSSISFLTPLVAQASTKNLVSFANLDSTKRETTGAIKAVGIANRIPILEDSNGKGKKKTGGGEHDSIGFICSPSMINYCGTYGGLQQYKTDILSIQLIGGQIQREMDSPISPFEYIKEGFNYMIISKIDEIWWEYGSKLLQSNEATMVYREESFILIKFISTQALE
jgi:hypothetical protein